MKDNCLTVTCCSVGRAYSPKYFYFHYPSASQKVGVSTQQRSSRDTALTFRAQTSGWFPMPEMGLKSTLATQGSLKSSAGEPGYRKMPAPIALGTQ